jgi:hypothetical protein
MVGYLSDDFCHAAGELICARGPLKPALLWAATDHGQFDLNSCLREAMILLKCFLRVLPNQQLQAFQRTVSGHMPVVDPGTRDAKAHESGLQGVLRRPSSLRHARN